MQQMKKKKTLHEANKRYPFQWHAELGSNVHPGRSNTLGGARRE